MISGLGSILRAISLLRQNPRLLLLLLLAPWTINLILFLGAWSLMTHWLTGVAEAYIAQATDGWWESLLMGLGTFVAAVLAAALAYLITVIAAIAVAAPFHDRLSAATERAANHDAATPAGIGWIASFKEGGKTALVLLVAEIFLLPLHFIPGVGSLLFAIASAMVITLGLMDIPLARRDWTLAQKRHFARRNAAPICGLAVGIGGVSLIPLANLLTLPIMVMAATLVVASGVRTEPG